MKLCESGTALAVDMRVLVSKMEESIEAHYQASWKTAQDPDGGPFSACPSGKSWDEASGKTGSGKKFYHNVISGASSRFLRCQLQLHRNKRDLQGFEFHCGQRPGKCHETQGRVHSRRASSDVGSGEATRVCRH